MCSGIFVSDFFVCLLKWNKLNDIQDVLAGGILKGMTVHAVRQVDNSVAFQCTGSARVRKLKL